MLHLLPLLALAGWLPSVVCPPFQRSFSSYDSRNPFYQFGVSAVSGHNGLTGSQHIGSRPAVDVVIGPQSTHTIEVPFDRLPVATYPNGYPIQTYPSQPYPPQPVTVNRPFQPFGPIGNNIGPIVQRPGLVVDYHDQGRGGLYPTHHISTTIPYIPPGSTSTFIPPRPSVILPYPTYPVIIPPGPSRPVIITQPTHPNLIPGTEPTFPIKPIDPSKVHPSGLGPNGFPIPIHPYIPKERCGCNPPPDLKPNTDTGTDTSDPSPTPAPDPDTGSTETSEEPETGSSEAPETPENGSSEAPENGSSEAPETGVTEGESNEMDPTEEAEGEVASTEAPDEDTEETMNAEKRKRKKKKKKKRNSSYRFRSG